MKYNVKKKHAFSGMMHAHDFKAWYICLKKRLSHEWSVEDLSFLFGKPTYYYGDFEMMNKVGNFLIHEGVMLYRIFGSFDTEEMEFHKEERGLNEERLVRLSVEDNGGWNTYTISVPWEFASVQGAATKPAMHFEEWKGDVDIQLESDMLLHVRIELEKLMSINFFKVRQHAIDIFERIKKTELYHHRIRPVHIKQGIYLLIQQAKLVVRNDVDRYCFQEDY